MQELDKIDCLVMRLITGEHFKVPLQMLCLETSAIPLRHIISMRRMVCFQTLDYREEKELTRKVHEAQR